jgi:hypothetical protein
MSPLARAWYRLTAQLSRRLPTTPDEYARFKGVLVGAYGVPDEPKSWITVAGHIRSLKSHLIRCPWGHIANAAKRLGINELATADHKKAVATLNDRLKTAMTEEIERMRAAGEDTREAETYLRRFNGEQDPQEQPQGDAVAVSAPAAQA